MRRGLALTGPQRCFQLLMEPLVFLLELINLPLLLFDLSLLLFDLLLLPVQLLLANKIEYFRLPSTLPLASGCHHPPYSSGSGVICPAINRPICGIGTQKCAGDLADRSPQITRPVGLILFQLSFFEGRGNLRGIQFGGKFVIQGGK
jgi:hypothetical protein